ncbi:hypothetical protein [Arsenicicoccus dermatophilus]|uniref:antitoxin VbhA family protein n=1 Tax=Arsenicicoccus dermatophilus TaxID=1076331 RepID=UPI0038914338
MAPLPPLAVLPPSGGTLPQDGQGWSSQEDRVGISSQERAARRRAVDNARHSIETDGGCPDDDPREVEEAYVAGEVTSAEVLAAAARRPRRLAPCC